jgi:inner membrane protein
LQRSPDMASVFGHVLASTAIGMAFFPKQSRNMLILGGICAFLPDADVLGFYWGVSYSSQWGHRGCTHSIVFALLIGLLALAVYRNTQRRSIAWYLLLATLSHPLLDMLTNGGRGVALWWPVSVQRIFFPCRPIQVSPIGITDFLGSWGMQVLWSELFWIGVPSLMLVMSARYYRRNV